MVWHSSQPARCDWISARVSAGAWPSRYAISSSGVGEWTRSVAAMGGPHGFQRARLQRRFERHARAKQLRTDGIQRDAAHVGDFLVGELFVFAEHEDLPVAFLERCDGVAHPDRLFAIGGATGRRIRLERFGP